MSRPTPARTATEPVARPWRRPTALLALLCRLFTGAVFLYASLDKITHPGDFAEMVDNYRLVPLGLLNPMALYLPAVEATVGIALLTGVYRRGASLLATLMMIVFTAAVVSAVARGLDISCGCFSVEDGHTVAIGLVIRDLFLLAVAAVPLFAPHPGWGLGDLTRRR